MGRNRPQFPRHLDEIPNYLNHITDWSDELRTTLPKVVDKLVKRLHKLPDYSIKEIIKGGSLGKGTAMKKGSDIDLIVFFNEYNSIEDLMADKHQIIYDIFNYFNKFDYMSFVRYDEYLIQYKIMDINSNKSFHVDIVPAMRVVPDHYSHHHLISVYKEMELKPDNIRNHYSTCFAKVQRELVQNKPDNVRDLICLLKSWKNRFHVPIKSYCCEVIALFVHCKCFDEDASMDVGEAFLEAMRFLSRYKTLYIILPFYYKIKRWRRYFPNKPYILDPVNPFSDTTDRTLDQCDTVKIEQCAEKTFQIFISGNRCLSRSLSYLKEGYIEDSVNMTLEKLKPEYSAINIDVNPPREDKGKLQFSGELHTIVKMTDINEDRSVANSQRRETSVYFFLPCLLIFALLMFVWGISLFVHELLLLLFPMDSKFTTASNSDL